MPPMQILNELIVNYPNNKNVLRMINMGMLHTIQTQDFLVAVLVALKALVVSEVKDSLEVIQVDSKIFSIHSLVAAVVVVEIVPICHVKGQIYNMSWT